MIPTKICGITNLEDAIVAVENGASAIGFIFYEESPRAISIQKAKSISEQLSESISRIGVFVNHDKVFIDKCIQSVPLNMIQLHGDETPKFCNQFSLPVLKALRIKNQDSLSIMNNFNVAGFLLDTFSNDQYGGTGKIFDWSLLNGESKASIILSVGLNSNNILNAITAVNPSAIDINSGVELSPGVKDHEKIELLFKNLKKTKSTGFNFG
jgi:phosphoribosylanthranilate isomerase